MFKFSSVINPAIKRCFPRFYGLQNITKKSFSCSSVYRSLYPNQNYALFTFSKIQKTRVCGLWADGENCMSSRVSCNLKPIETHRMIHTTIVNRTQQPQRRTNARIIYYQSPIAWLKNQYRIKQLQRSWDPEFTQAEFIRGSKQAMSVVTNMVSKDNVKALEGLVAKPELFRIDKDIKKLWSSNVVQNVGVTPEEIKVAVPIDIQLDTSSGLLETTAIL